MSIEWMDIVRARERLRPLLHHTELDPSSTFSAMTGGQIYLKCENRQKTGSFKIRGASNKLSAMAERGDRSPVVASSAGNHAQGVAYASKLLGIPATIVMPAAAPIAKVQATAGYGAKVVLHGSCYDEAYQKACEICEAEGAEFLHPYNDEEVIAGQGTLGLEILEDLPDADIIIAPAGGGGLLAGIALAVKLSGSKAKVYGVQAEGADAIVRSFETKSYVTTDYSSTIADGISVRVPGDKTVEIINKYADGMVRVSESEIADAVLLLLERCKQVVEPAGATPVAAVLSGKIDVKGKKVVCLLSGGNIDVSFIQTIIERGLVARHRRIKLIVTVVDRPGSLMGLLSIVAQNGGNILKIEHDKLSAGLNPNEIKVHIDCEVSGKEHGDRLVEAIRSQNHTVETEDWI